jgi:hypothetical protein
LTERRRLNHDIRNGLNTLILNVQCLPISTGDELVECLDAIIGASDAIVTQVDELIALPEEPAVNPSS